MHGMFHRGSEPEYGKYSMPCAVYVRIRTRSIATMGQPVTDSLRSCYEYHCGIKTSDSETASGPRVKYQQQADARNGGLEETRSLYQQKLIMTMQVLADAAVKYARPSTDHHHHTFYNASRNWSTICCPIVLLRSACWPLGP